MIILLIIMILLKIMMLNLNILILKKEHIVLLKNLEDEDMGQLIYILAHLVDDKKLEMLNKIVEENSN